MKTETEIKYTLRIGEADGHGIDYPKNLNNDIAGFMIAMQVLETNLESLHETKKLVKGADKKSISKQISLISNTIKGMRFLTLQLCDSYESLMNRK